MDSGLYIVTLNNSEPISVNAQDPRIAHKAIKVTQANCKFGKAKSLKGREKNYFKTFGEHNVNFKPVALVEDFAKAEKAILTKLDQYRIRGRTGRKNEWLQDIEPGEVERIVLRELVALNLPFERVQEESPIGDRMADFDPLVLTPCETCKHRISGFTCKAFPERIPQVILIGDHQHREPFPGDKGIQYEEKG